MFKELPSRRIVVGAILSFAPFAAMAQNTLSDRARGLLNQIPGTTATRAPAGAGLSQNEIGLGLKDALKVASQRVIGRVGKADGYNGDPAIRIPLPDALQRIESPLRSVGAGGLLDDLQLKMNRGAEQAAPKALNIFVDAATRMSFDDARTILTGPQDSATQYFRRTTSGALTSSFRPIVNTALSGVGAVAAFNTVQTRAKGIPFIGQSIGDFSLTDFTVGKALDGLFHYLAVEEGSIRSNPVARSTELLRKIFG
jgi:Protein of unknown function (DUF4197)